MGAGQEEAENLQVGLHSLSPIILHTVAHGDASQLSVKDYANEGIHMSVPDGPRHEHEAVSVQTGHFLFCPALFPTRALLSLLGLSATTVVPSHASHVEYDER